MLKIRMLLREDTFDRFGDESLPVKARSDDRKLHENEFFCLNSVGSLQKELQMSEQTKCPECGGIVVPVLPDPSILTDPSREPRACLRCQTCGKEFEWLEAEYTERWQDG